MRKFHAVLAVSLALSFGSVGVSLADGYDGNSIKDTPTETEFSWTGPYVGLQAGKQTNGGITYEDQVPSNFDGPGHPTSDKLDGFIGGGHVGYNLQFNRLVLGVEASIDGGDVDVSRLEVPANNYTVNTDVNYIAALAGRIGLAHDRFLIYGKAGVAYIDFDYDASFVNPDTSVTARSHSFSDVGYVIGGGVEYALTNHITVGAEYEHYEFGGDTVSISQPGDCCNTTNKLKADNIDADVIQGRLGLRF